MENFGKVCFVLLTIIVGAFIGGFMFMKLWEWFIVYAFAVKPLTFIESLGVAFFWSYLKYTKAKDEEKFSIELLYKAWGNIIIWSIMILGTGWIITLFQ